MKDPAPCNHLCECSYWIEKAACTFRLNCSSPPLIDVGESDAAIEYAIDSLRKP